MKLAVIDCGTNTFNLVIVDWLGPRSYSRLFSTRIPVKLGEGAINKGFIAEQPFNRGLDAIRSFREEIAHHDPVRTLAFATSAIRDASNGADFVAEVKRQLDIHIQVIDGDREAELIYFGIREAVALGEQTSLIMDIGGGSTEFILADREHIFWKQSFKIGAARLLDRFSPSSPITQEEVKAIYDYLFAETRPLFEAVKRYPPAELVGSSGAFESLVEMISGELGGEPLTGDKTEYQIHLPDHFRISELVRRSTLEERRQIKGLVPMRFDMIVISCLMVDFILTRLELSRLRVSTYSLKEGALIDFINSKA